MGTARASDHVAPGHAAPRRRRRPQPTLDTIPVKTRLRQRWVTAPMHAWQVSLVNRLLDGFDGKLTGSKRVPGSRPRRSDREESRQFIGSP